MAVTGMSLGDRVTPTIFLHRFYTEHSPAISPSDDKASQPTELPVTISRVISMPCAVGATYFFEWCVWLGHAVYGVAFAPWGLIALAPQAIILGSIFGVTGIPPTEEQALRSKGDAYRAYQARVSRFIPRQPKRA
jgi:Protein of unknown function (DUF1295)